MKCQFATKNKKSCQANAMKDGQYCFSHSPSTRLQHKQATQKGGSVGYDKDSIPLDPIDLADPRMVLYLLADTINRTRRVRPDGSMDVRIANSIGFLAGKMLDAQNQVTFEERLATLEKVANRAKESPDQNIADDVLNDRLEKRIFGFLESRFGLNKEEIVMRLTETNEV